jgi:hypothetical protein
MAAGIKKIDDDSIYNTEWYREQAAIAKRQNLEHIAKHDRSFSAVLAKLLADDEPERDDGGGGVDHHVSRLADLVAEGSGGKVDRAAALGWLLHHRDGIALARTHKAKESSMESIEKLKAARVEKLEQLAKSSGAVAVAKHVLAEGPSGITKADFNRMCNADWQRDRRSGESYDQCFSRHYIAPEARDVRKADQMLGAAAPYFDPQVQVVGGEDARDVNDPTAALAALHRIGRERWPEASEAVRFTRAFEANPDLAKQAHVRPAATTVYEFPR